MKSFIPNALTTLNLIFGIFAILAAFDGKFTQSCLLIIAAAIADGLDGRAARYFKVSSDFGKELDSLCDLVSFGAAPGILCYAFILKDLGYTGYIIAAAFATCGALRLARFNVNASTVKGHFVGMPIPAGGCALATFVLAGVKPSAYIFAFIVILFAYLMISTIKYPDFKGQGEKTRILPIVVTAAVCGYVLFLMPQTIVFIPIFAYALFGILNAFFGILAKGT